MFFPKLRKHAKWVFVLLAIVFAGGFVFLGVGSGSNGHSPPSSSRHDAYLPRPLRQSSSENSWSCASAPLSRPAANGL